MSKQQGNLITEIQLKNNKIKNNISKNNNNQDLDITNNIEINNDILTIYDEHPNII